MPAACTLSRLLGAPCVLSHQPARECLHIPPTQASPALRTLPCRPAATTHASQLNSTPEIFPETGSWGGLAGPAESKAHVPLAVGPRSHKVLFGPCYPEPQLGAGTLHQSGSHLLAELAASNPSSGASPPSQTSTITLGDLGLPLEEGLASPELLSLEEISERYESSQLASTASIPERDSPKHWAQLEQWLADLQAEVASLRGHKDRCERAVLSLLREMLQLRACVQLQDAELKRLQEDLPQEAWAPGKEALELPSPQNQNQMQTLDKRLVEVREALTQIRRKQALQDSERKDTEQKASLRLAELAGRLGQEKQFREAACSALQKSQEDAGQRLDREVAKMQAQVTKLGEEMSLRFLKREAKLCGFLQKSFLALEKRMKASECTRLQAESSLRGELERRGQRLQELAEERVRALQGLHEQEEGRLLEQCRGLDQAVIQLTKFVRQNQVSLNRILRAEQKAWDSKGHLEESRAEELATFLQESLEAGQLAQQEAHSVLELLQEKSQALEVSLAKLGKQVKDLSDHLVALSWRLDLQEQTLSVRLCEAKREWEGSAQKWLEGLAQCQQEAEARLREVRQCVDSLPRQIEAVSDKCILHKSDSDLKISSEGKAREFEVGAVRQELAALLSSVQLLREGNPGRKIAEIQGKLATFQNQIMKLENSIQDNKTIQNLKFNTETKLRMEETASLRDSIMRLRSEEGPWSLRLGSRGVLTPLGKQRSFVKDAGPGDAVPVNHWGVYQAVRWLQWKAVLMNLVARRRPSVFLVKSFCQEPAHQLTSVPLSQK
ncbi:coiled-coil domain-containing protein 154 [Ursus americanus]|uniref:coiled-coil domain-containing protein 154 n=1 Tax=Ursus americanus TaxID=9643 RepID=UPI001E67D962|nr:coiled-coil domain-containing protein 154 [Ursus americanus]